MHTPAPNQFTPANAEDVEVVFFDSTNRNASDIDVELANRSTGDVNVSSANNLQTTEQVNSNSTNDVYKGMKKSTIGVVAFVSLSASVLVAGGYGIEASKSTQTQTNFSESDCVATKAPSVVKAKSTKSPSSKTSKTRSPTLSKSSKKKRRRCGKSTKAPTPSPTQSLSPSLSPSTSIKPSELPSELPSSRPSIQPSTSTQPSDQPSLFPSASVEPSTAPSELPSSSSKPSIQPSISTQPSDQPSLFPSASGEPSMAPSELPSSSSRPSNQPSTQPSGEPSLFPSASAEPSMTPSCLSQPQPTCSTQLHGGGWIRVRHVPAGSTWHPATDNLNGTDVYGTESIECAPWSVDFASKVAGDSYNEFLFATGDCTKWLVATTDAVIGETYTNQDRPILASSDNPSSSTVAKWYNRASQDEDPWVSIIDHGPAIGAGKILYGEASYGGNHAANILPSSEGADVYVKRSCAHLYGGGWVRVRHVPAGNTWHPATDSLAGTEVYGTESFDSDPWSVNFASKVAGYNQFLFATGDCNKWLAATTDAVIGETYTNQDRPILASSDNPSSSTVAKWYNRASQAEDPWVSIIDHIPAIGAGKILYGEASYGGGAGHGDHAANILPSSEGADVYVKRSCAHLYGGGWIRVRHVPAGNTWHPATDNLAGTEVYGTESFDSAPWSVDFASKVAGDSYNEFLFATGDCTKWLVATTDAVIGETYTNQDRPILASSDNPSSSTVAKWYNRASQAEDPWVSIIDHIPAITAGKILYGEASYGGNHAANILPSSEGADVYIKRSCAHLHGGGWVRVRHVPAGNTWHPATDSLDGTEVYGTENFDSAPWSVNFASKVVGYNQFLFATGDCTKWLAATTDAVIGSNYSNELRNILASSDSASFYSALWYNRAGQDEDPWVSIIDHIPAITAGKILYGEASYAGNDAAIILPSSGGADVYVRFR